MRTLVSSALVAGAAAALVASPLVAACGSAKPVVKSADTTSGSADGGPTDDAATEGGSPSACTGADIDLVNVLVQSACEVQVAPSDAKRRDVSALLDVKVLVSQNEVAPGAHADVTVTFSNKSQAPLTLDFMLDPTPRFTIETYTSTNKRAELPKTSPPHGKGDNAAEPTAPGTAEITITPGGKASARLPWDAVKKRWAPELVKGTPVELGYPTAPAGPLPRGKYLLKVITPLIGVFEGSDHEVSTGKTTIIVK